MNIHLNSKYILLISLLSIMACSQQVVASKRIVPEEFTEKVCKTIVKSDKAELKKLVFTKNDMVVLLETLLSYFKKEAKSEENKSLNRLMKRLGREKQKVSNDKEFVSGLRGKVFKSFEMLYRDAKKDGVNLAQAKCEKVGAVMFARQQPEMKRAIKEMKSGSRYSAFLLVSANQKQYLIRLYRVLELSERSILAGSIRWMGIDDKRRDLRGIESLIKALKDKDVIVKSKAITALRRLNDPRAIGPLIDALKDKDVQVKTKVITALGMAKDARAVGPLIDALKNGEVKVKNEAIRALERLKDTRAIGPLIDALKDKDKYVRSFAAFALMGFEDPRIVVAYIKALKIGKGSDRNFAAMALGRINDPKAIEPLINTLRNDKDETTRAIAAESLGQFKSPKALKAVISALNDQGIDVRSKAVQTLAKLKNPKAVMPLKTALKRERKLLGKTTDASKKRKHGRLIENIDKALSKIDAN